MMQATRVALAMGGLALCLMLVRSKAVLTFVVQLSCQHSGYVPTARAVRGGGYSAERYLVAPEGGRVLVDRTVEAINGLWNNND